MVVRKAKSVNWFEVANWKAETGRNPHEGAAIGREDPQSKLVAGLLMSTRQGEVLAAAEFKIKTNLMRGKTSPRRQRGKTW